MQLQQIKHGPCWRQSTVSVTCRDSTDYRDSTMDNTNYKDMGYYHRDVAEDDTPSDCDNYSTSDQTTYTGSTRGANLSLPGSKESRHLHLMGKTQITYRQAQVTLNSFISIRLPNMDICRLLTEGRLDTNTCSHQLEGGRASNTVYLISGSRPSWFQQYI